MLSKIGDIFFKKIELWVLLLILIAGVFLTVLIANQAQKKAAGDNSGGFVGKVAFGISTLPELMKKTLLEVTGNTNRFATPDVKHWDLLDSAEYSGGQAGYLTRTSVDESEYELIRLSDGSTYRKWVNLPYLPRAVSLYDDTLLLGGVVGPEDSSKALKKYNLNGEQLWSTEIAIHHTVYVDSKGFIYTPIQMPTHTYVQSLMPDGGVYRDDGYAILDAKGNILETRSVTQILIDNDLGYLLFGVGALEKDGIHLNAVKVAEIKSEFWEIGDLIMSSRHLSLVFIYRPSTGKVIWHSAGPWLNQHDPDFLNNAEISVFGNDMASTFSNRVSEDANYINGGNNIYVYNFETQQTSIRYPEVMEEVELATVTSGGHHIFADGSLFVWFSNTGISILYNKTTDSISYFGQKQDESRVDRARAILYVPEPVKSP